MHQPTDRTDTGTLLHFPAPPSAVAPTTVTTVTPPTPAPPAAGAIPWSTDPPLDYSAAGNVERWLTLARGYIGVNGTDPWIYDGRRWQADRKGPRTAHALAETVRRLLAVEARLVPPELRQAAADWAKSTDSVRALRAMVARGLDDPSLDLDPDLFDSDPLVLNCANGTVDLRTGTLRPHRADDLLTKLSPVPWEPGAPCPHWLRFLDQISGRDANWIRQLQQFGGYSLTGIRESHAWALFFGPPGGGKSTVMRTMERIWGDYAATGMAKMLLPAPHEARTGADPDVAKLAGKRLVWVDEFPRHGVLDEGRIKLFTGGDAHLETRALFQNSFAFVPRFKLILATNYLPPIAGDADAMWQRVRPLPFQHCVVRDGSPGAGPPADPSLPRTLEAEFPGILQWFAQGARDFLAAGNRLTTAPISRAALAAYRADNDPVGKWLDAAVITPGADGWRADLDVKQGDLYDSYIRAAGPDAPLLTKAQLKAELIRRYPAHVQVGNSTRQNNQVVYTGLALH